MTNAPENNVAAKSVDDAAKRIFLPIGWFWPLLVRTLILAVVGGAAIAAFNPKGGLIFGVSAAWVVAYFATLGVLMSCLMQAPLPGRLKVAVFVAIVLKLFLFFGGAILVIKSLQFVTENGLALWLLLGVHLLPLAAAARWIFGANKMANTISGDSGTGPDPSKTPTSKILTH